MKKIVPIFIAVLLTAVVGVWVLVSNKENQNTDTTATATVEKVQIGTSFYVLDEFVRTIGGEHVEVLVSPPAGIDVHSFEPTARQVADLQSVDLFLFQGAGVDSWAEDIATELEGAGVTVIEMNEHISLRATDEDGHEEEHEDEEMHEEDEHEHGEFDPHTWLDPVLAQTMVDEIRAALTELDPDHATEYEKNADALQQQLVSLDAQYKEQLANCSVREIIVAHDAFEYVGARYDIEMHAIAGVSPEEEPSAKKLAELTELAREHGINYIFFEALTSPKTAETIANEVGAQSLVLDPIEGVSSDEQRGYIEIMEDNLQNLQTGMGCSQ